MSASPTSARRHRLTAFATVAVVAGMTGLSFAAVPLYKMFCSLTGYGGTPQIATNGAPTTRGQRVLNVRFDANVAPGLPWSFSPEQTSIDLRTGETATVFFKVKNNSKREWAAMAAYNVSPDQSGLYFTKISCFCFNEQKLGAGESAEFPVVFYLDPALEKDESMRDVGGVTLSYTFFASKTQPSAVATVGDKPKL
jgi:cytochrome c oxidase assembly protein subunit 11